MRLGIVNVLGQEGRGAREVGVRLDVVETKLALSAAVRAHLVKDVIVALTVLLVDHARLLKQVVGDRGGGDNTRGSIEVNIDVLTETRRVVVTECLGVSESLEQRVGQNDLLLYVALRAGNVGEIVKALLGTNGLAGTRLTTDEDALVLLCVHEITVRAVGDVVHMRWQRLVGRPVGMELDLLRAVKVNALVRVDADEDGASSTDPCVQGVFLVAKTKSVNEHGLVVGVKHD
mmetsp:Transcript_13763/g.22376  ORF Transcript_13763/g.22376 Transcript_13763/m.22376 type:complete len:232 (-) Transcript_13763:169-864(-)